MINSGRKNILEQSSKEAQEEDKFNNRIFDERLNEVADVAISEVSAISHSQKYSGFIKRFNHNKNDLHTQRSNISNIVFWKSPETTLRKNLEMNFIWKDGEYTPKIDSLYFDFPENSTCEIEGGISKNIPFKFQPNYMDLKLHK